MNSDNRKLGGWLTLLLAIGFCNLQAVSADNLGVAGDTWVREDQPNDNRDSDDVMNARTDADGDDNDVVFLRFDTGAIVAPSSGAALNLTWYRSDSSTGKTLSLWGINDSTAGDVAWDETLITYNDAPGLIPDGLDPTMEIALGHDDADIHDLDIGNLTLLVADLPYGPQVEGELYTFASPALDTFLNADTNGVATFLITRNTDTSGNQARFIQKEALTFNSGSAVPSGGAGAFLSNVVVPEPTSLGLLITATLMSLLLRRP